MSQAEDMAATGKSESVTTVSIQDVSRLSGLSEPTLRYYEKIGLIGPVPRDESSGHRRYDGTAVETIEALSCLRAAGMSVRDMRAYLRYLDAAGDNAAEMRDLFLKNAERVAQEIEQMQTRLRYLQLKADLWDARQRGDIGAEHRAVQALTNVVADFR
ncbi:MerR family transcriptional regulator [Nonomuraea sp. CA-143628]|uniref:MerR family transcriptional regulator n=1 Tax=Nonomuraea sp. CA-143628 TaxID=3239997 RepID=UPI003D8FAAC0